MITLTPAAHRQLSQLLAEHPMERLARIEIKDIDDHRLVFNITLEPEAKADDNLQDCDGLTIAVAANSVSRMQGVVLDYTPTAGFKFDHPSPPQASNALGLIHLN